MTTLDAIRTALANGYRDDGCFIFLEERKVTRFLFSDNVFWRTLGPRLGRPDFFQMSVDFANHISAGNTMDSFFAPFQ